MLHLRWLVETWVNWVGFSSSEHVFSKSSVPISQPTRSRGGQRRAMGQGTEAEFALCSMSCMTGSSSHVQSPTRMCSKGSASALNKLQPKMTSWGKRCHPRHSTGKGTGPQPWAEKPWPQLPAAS